MTTDRDSGAPAWTLRPGGHAVAPFARPDQRDGVIRSFLGQGLRAGDKCICITESASPAKVLEDAGVDVGVCVSGRNLDLLSSADAYCPDGRIRAPELLDRWRGFFEDALSGSPSFSCIRVAAEVSVMTARDSSGIEELFRSELAYNRVFARYPLQIVCLYDIHRFSGALMTLLRTHPQLVVGGLVMDNSAYVGST